MNGEKNTLISITAKDLILGSVGAIIGGVMVWLFTENVRLHAVIKAQEAVEAIRPNIDEALRLSEKAKREADQALLVVRRSSKEVYRVEAEVQRIFTDLKATPLFEKVEKSMDELREVAKIEARKVALDNFVDTNIKTFPIKIYDEGDFVFKHDLENYNDILFAYILYQVDGLDFHFDTSFLRISSDAILGRITSSPRNLFREGKGKTELVLFFKPKEPPTFSTNDYDAPEFSTNDYVPDDWNGGKEKME